MCIYISIYIYVNIVKGTWAINHLDSICCLKVTVRLFLANWQAESGLGWSGPIGVSRKGVDPLCWIGFVGRGYGATHDKTHVTGNKLFQHLLKPTMFFDGSSCVTVFVLFSFFFSCFNWISRDAANSQMKLEARQILRKSVEAVWTGKVVSHIVLETAASFSMLLHKCQGMYIYI